MNQTRVHWWDRLQSPRPSVTAKSRWRILREGADLKSVLAIADTVSSWNVVAERGDYSRGAIKCLLQSILHNDECEMVVLFPKKGNRATVCVSSQIGCAVGCQFCSTGAMGFRRNLSSHEILEQVYLARCLANRFGRSLRNVVFMGMGEPLHNCESLWQSLSGMISDSGFGLSPKGVTVSTAVGGIKLIETAEQFPNIRFALSLHSANPTIRNVLVPKAPSHPERLKEVVRSINQIQSNEPLWLEMTLLKDVNDRWEDVESLADFCQTLKVQINLIPYNPMMVQESPSEPENVTAAHNGFAWQPTAMERIFEIAQFLRRRGLTVRVRHSFGDQDQAACGQLAIFRQGIGTIQPCGDQVQPD